MNNVIVYTDGGATEITKDSRKYFMGAGVYAENPNNEKKNYVVISGSLDGSDTNNSGELKAMVWTLENIDSITPNGEKLNIFADSQYVLQGMKGHMFAWAKNNWIKKSDGQPVKNMELWKRIYACRHVIKDRVDQLSWVKGHSGVEGNEIADRLATIGQALQKAGRGNEVLVFDNLKDANNLIASATEDKPKKTKVIQPSPLMCLRRCVDVVNRNEVSQVGEDMRLVFMTSFKDDANHPGWDAGLPSGDNFEAIIVTNGNMEIYDMVMDYQNSILGDDLQCPVLLHWDKIKSDKFYKTLWHNREAGLNFINNDVYDNTKENRVTNYRNPARLAIDLIDRSNDAAVILGQALNGDTDCVGVIDVTHLFYDKGVDKKGNAKVEIKPELNEKLTVDFTFDWVKNAQGGFDMVADPNLVHKHKLIMSMGFQIPSRNDFNKILKEDKEVKVQFMHWDWTERFFRWALLITTPSGVGMYYNPASSIRILP